MSILAELIAWQGLNRQLLAKPGSDELVDMIQRILTDSNTRVIAVSSGKGGVGKSSVTVNLAAAVAARGFTVGVLDADIWGFSIPRLLGIDEPLEAHTVDERPKIFPNEITVGRGLSKGVLKVVSTGFMVGEDTALMWRGLMLTKAVEQFLRDVHWGELDYLFIDMPPGTGDVQMGLARLLPRTDLLIVTTPALAAQKVAARAAVAGVEALIRRGRGQGERLGHASGGNGLGCLVCAHEW